MNDPFLRLRDSDGNLIASDDDGGPGRSSAITYTATETGSYYIDAQSYANSGAGDYALSMTLGNNVSYDVEMGAGNLIRDGYSWGSQPGESVDITWGIRQSGTEPSGGNAFVQLSAAQVAATSDIMDYIDGVTGITFNQVNEGGTTNNATILLGSYSASDGSGAYAYFPGSEAATARSGDVWLNNNAGSTTNLQIGSYSYFTILHELGHALGLAHPGEYNAAPGVSITYGNNAQFVEDSHQYSVMSYFDESHTTTSVGGYPDTLMLFDLYALHQLYGADYGFHSEDTVYGFNATEGGAYDFAANTNPLLSIWDGGGNDTIDLSGYSMDQMLNLTDGEFSDVGRYEGNLSIAVGAVIENGIGGSGNDQIYGNQIKNNLSGGDGLDVIEGFNGADRIKGGAQADDLNGGNGNDIIWGGDGADYIRGGSGTDNLRGNNGNDEIRGGDGNDRLYGHGGNDVLSGMNGHDKLYGGTNDDTLNGGNGNDTFIFNGDTGNDVIEDFGNGADRLLFDTALLGGASNGQAIVNEFAQVTGGGVLFDFGGGNSVLLEGVNTLNGLADDVFAA
jgi:serralysin